MQHSLVRPNRIRTGHHHIVSATALIHRTARPSISAMSSLLGNLVTGYCRTQKNINRMAQFSFISINRVEAVFNCLIRWFWLMSWCQRSLGTVCHNRFPNPNTNLNNNPIPNLTLTPIQTINLP